MKVAVSASGKDLDSVVDQKFGRAEYLLIVDADSYSVVEVIDNQAAKTAEHGAGIGAASRIAEAGAQVILTGFVGPKAAAVCEKAGISIVNGVSGTVREAVSAYVQKNTDQAMKKTACTTNPSPSAAGYGGERGMGQGKGMGGGKRQGQCGCQRKNRQN